MNLQIETSRSQKEKDAESKNDSKKIEKQLADITEQARGIEQQ